MTRFARGESDDYPPFPENYLYLQQKAVLDEYRGRLSRARDADEPAPELPEALLTPHLENTWHDTGEAIVGNWMGLVYQLTHSDRRKPFMDGIDPADPLGLKRA